MKPLEEYAKDGCAICGPLKGMCGDCKERLALLRAVVSERVRECADTAEGFRFDECERHCNGHHESDVGEAIADDIRAAFPECFEEGA